MKLDKFDEDLCVSADDGRRPLEFDLNTFTNYKNHVEITISPFLNHGTNIVFKITSVTPTKLEYRNYNKIGRDRVADDIVTSVTVPFVIVDESEVSFIKDCIQHNKFAEFFIYFITNCIKDNFEFYVCNLYNVSFIYLDPNSGKTEVLSNKQFIFYSKSEHLFIRPILNIAPTKESRRLFFKQFGTAFESVKFITYNRGNKNRICNDCKTIIKLMKKSLSFYNSNQKFLDEYNIINKYIDQCGLIDTKNIVDLKYALKYSTTALTNVLHCYECGDNFTAREGCCYCSIHDHKAFHKLQNWCNKHFTSPEYKIVTTVVMNTFIVCYRKLNIE